MKEHNANTWTREGADGRLCQPRALAIEARRAETRERLRSRERSPCKARERPSPSVQPISRHSRRWAAGLVYSFLKRPDWPGSWRAFPPASDVYGDRRRTSFAKVAKVATYAK